MQIENGILEFPIEHLNSGYGYAYANKDGKGFSDTEPFVNVDFATYDDAKKAAIQSASTFGLKNVILFKYDENLPESITWDYVKEHYVDSIMQVV